MVLYGSSFDTEIMLFNAERRTATMVIKITATPVKKMILSCGRTSGTLSAEFIAGQKEKTIRRVKAR